MAALSDPHAASHLALLARLELLHQSSLLRHTPSSPHAEDEKEAVGQEDSVLVPDEDKETVVEGWEEIRDLCRLMGDGLRDGPSGACALSLADGVLPSSLAGPKLTLLSSLLPWNQLRSARPSLTRRCRRPCRTSSGSPSRCPPP